MIRLDPLPGIAALALPILNAMQVVSLVAAEVDGRVTMFDPRRDVAAYLDWARPATTWGL